MTQLQSKRFIKKAALLLTLLNLYCQYGHGMEKEVAQNVYFLSLRSSFNYIRLSKKYFLRFNPQFYYLKLDARDGFYLAGDLALARRDFPLSISTLINRPLQTDIAGKDFDWNISLTYSFGRNYMER